NSRRESVQWVPHTVGQHCYGIARRRPGRYSLSRVVSHRSVVVRNDIRSKHRSGSRAAAVPQEGFSAMTLETNADQPARGSESNAASPGLRPRKKPRHSLIAQGEPMIWLTGGALTVSLAMILILLFTVFWHGLQTLWPAPIAQVRLITGAVYLGEFTRS